MFYKIVHHIVAVPTTMLIPTDPRIRQFHPFTYRHLHAFKYPYKYSFFTNTIIHWNLLPQTIVICMFFPGGGVLELWDFITLKTWRVEFYGV
jgi:hypothetical protein